MAVKKGIPFVNNNLLMQKLITDFISQHAVMKR